MDKNSDGFLAILLIKFGTKLGSFVTTACNYFLFFALFILTFFPLIFNQNTSMFRVGKRYWFWVLVVFFIVLIAFIVVCKVLEISF